MHQPANRKQARCPASAYTGLAASPRQLSSKKFAAKCPLKVQRSAKPAVTMFSVVSETSCQGQCGQRSQLPRPLSRLHFWTCRHASELFCITRSSLLSVYPPCFFTRRLRCARLHSVVCHLPPRDWIQAPTATQRDEVSGWSRRPAPVPTTPGGVNQLEPAAPGPRRSARRHAKEYKASVATQ